VDTGKHKWPAVYWQAAERVNRDFGLGDTVDLVFRVTRNWFNGKESPQLVVNDLKRSGE
jgi:single-stranded-DNA-specific exonuclease